MVTTPPRLLSLCTANPRTLVYHLGVRESFGMYQNILLVHDTDKDATMALKLNFNSNYYFVSYNVATDNTLVVSEPTAIINDNMRISLVSKLKLLMKDLEVQSKVLNII